MKRSKNKSRSQLPEESKATDVSDGLEGAEFEQKLILIWENYRQVIFTVIGVIILSLLVYQSMLYLAGRKELAVETAYQEAENDDALINFAQEHPHHALAGFAYLQVANKKYEEEEFLQAAEYYSNAVNNLVETTMLGRARLGFAMSHLLGGNADDGVEALNKIAGDPSLLDTYRAEAAYQLAVNYWEKSDYASLDRALRQIETLKKSGMWVSKATVMRNSIPELRELADK